MKMNSPPMSSANGNELLPIARYAEADTNPFPEVMIASAPEPRTTLSAPLQPDNTDALHGISADTPPPLTKWEKVKDWAALHKYWLFAAGVILLLSLIATIVAVAVVSQHSNTEHTR